MTADSSGAPPEQGWLRGSFREDCIEALAQIAQQCLAVALSKAYQGSSILLYDPQSSQALCIVSCTIRRSAADDDADVASCSGIDSSPGLFKQPTNLLLPSLSSQRSMIGWKVSKPELEARSGTTLRDAEFSLAAQQKLLTTLDSILLLNRFSKLCKPKAFWMPHMSMMLFSSRSYGPLLWIPSLLLSRISPSVSSKCSWPIL